MPPENTNDHLERLSQLAAKYRIPLDIEIVPSIQDWCELHGMSENNPFLAGKALHNNSTGRSLVLLANPITEDMISSVLTSMRISNTQDEKIALISNPRNFVTHLFLHELAHLLNPSWSEKDCDNWAFSELS